MVRRRAAVTGQLTFDDCLPDRPALEPRPRQRPAGTRYYLRPHSDLWDQIRRGRRTSRIVTIPIRGEYL